MTTLALLLAGCSASEEPRSQVESGPDDELVALTVYLSDDEGVALDCAAVTPVTFEVSASEENRPAAAVRRAIRDVEPSPSLHPDGTAPLSDYFDGVRVEQGTAVVAFRGEALVYLNGTSCMQAVTKTPIVRTLLELPDIDAVVWEIDGEIFEDWGA